MSPTHTAASEWVDWAIDTRPSRNLTDAELIEKMHWQLRALHSRERMQRQFESRVPTVYPPGEPTP